jgi:glycosyltransferase involved in cell wall biosynthesis
VVFVGESTGNPQVSVAILTYNSERTLEPCLKSVVREKPGQILAIDMGSTDRTLDILVGYGVEIVRNPTRSVGYSRQLAVTNARCSFLMFVDSDVILTPNCISILLCELKRLGWVGIHARVLSVKNETYWQRTEDARIRLYFNRTGLKNTMGIAAALFERQILLAYPFDPNLIESCEDLDFFLRLSQAGQKFGVSYPIVYHEHKREFREFTRQRFRYGLGRSRVALKYKSTSMLIDPLLTMLSSSLRSIFQGRIWLVPYWVVGGACRFMGVILGVRNSKRVMAKPVRTAMMTKGSTYPLMMIQLR